MVQAGSARRAFASSAVSEFSADVTDPIVTFKYRDPAEAFVWEVAFSGSSYLAVSQDSASFTAVACIEPFSFGYRRAAPFAGTS
jgi:hypothetical protein